VKLLFDENLSRRLPARVADLFPGSIHISLPGLLETDDAVVWKFAKENGYAIISADMDFFEMGSRLGPPPKVIWLSRCNYPTSTAERLIRSQAIRIAEFLDDAERAVLILRQQ
jgi:predicted nuclease of predicted toxin-antitoxin system